MGQTESHVNTNHSQITKDQHALGSNNNNNTNISINSNNHQVNSCNSNGINNAKKNKFYKQNKKSVSSIDFTQPIVENGDEIEQEHNTISFSKIDINTIRKTYSSPSFTVMNSNTRHYEIENSKINQPRANGKHITKPKSKSQRTKRSNKNTAKMKRQASYEVSSSPNRSQSMKCKHRNCSEKSHNNRSSKNGRNRGPPGVPGSNRNSNDVELIVRKKLITTTTTTTMATPSTNDLMNKSSSINNITTQQQQTQELKQKEAETEQDQHGQLSTSNSNALISDSLNDDITVTMQCVVNQQQANPTTTADAVASLVSDTTMYHQNNHNVIISSSLSGSNLSNLVKTDDLIRDNLPAANLNTTTLNRLTSTVKKEQLEYEFRLRPRSMNRKSLAYGNHHSNGYGPGEHKKFTKKKRPNSKNQVNNPRLLYKCICCGIGCCIMNQKSNKSTKTKRVNEDADVIAFINDGKTQTKLKNSKTDSQTEINSRFSILFRQFFSCIFSALTCSCCLRNSEFKNNCCIYRGNSLNTSNDCNHKHLDHDLDNDSLYNYDDYEEDEDDDDDDDDDDYNYDKADNISHSNHDNCKKRMNFKSGNDHRNVFSFKCFKNKKFISYKNRDAYDEEDEDEDESVSNDKNSIEESIEKKKSIKLNSRNSSSAKRNSSKKIHGKNKHKIQDDELDYIEPPPVTCIRVLRPSNDLTPVRFDSHYNIIQTLNIGSISGSSDTITCIPDVQKEQQVDETDGVFDENDEQNDNDENYCIDYPISINKNTTDF